MAPSPLDLGSSLARRKALIAKLMGQMGGQGQGGTRKAAFSTGFSQLGQPVRAGAANAPGFTRAFQAGAPQGIAASGLASANVAAPADTLGEAPAQLPAPAQETPGAQAGEQSDLLPPEPSAAAGGAQPWQTQGFVSESAFNQFMGLNEVDQMRIFQNPAARARYFSGV